MPATSKSIETHLDEPLKDPLLLGNYNKSNNILQPEVGFDSDEDIEFDNTQIESPKSLTNLSKQFRSRDGDDSNDYIEKNNSVKIPLNDNKVDTKSIRSSPPHRNGIEGQTKSPPKEQNVAKLYEKLQENEIVDGGNDFLQDNVEDSLIKHRKLISNNNRVNLNGNDSSFSTAKRNAVERNQFSSPIQRGDSADNIIRTSPPSHMKVRPFKFPESPSKSGSRRRDFYGNRDNDIEFDSSDVENDDTLAKEKKGDQGTKIANTGLETPRDQFPKEMETSTHTRKSNIFGSVPFYTDNKEDSSAALASNEGSRAGAGMKETDPIAKGDTKSPIGNNLHRNYGDVSREEILDKINATIDSLMEKDRSSASPPKKYVYEESKRSPSSDGSVSSGSQDEIFNELDSILTNSSRPPAKTSSIRASSKSHLNSTANRNISIEQKNNEGSPGMNILEGKYARELLQKKNMHAKKMSHVDPFSQYSVHKKNAAWSRDKWAKLRRLVKTKSLSREDIVNSEILQRRLESSKEELSKRVAFLEKLQGEKRIPHD